MQKALKFLMPCGLCAAVPALKPDAAQDNAKPCCDKSETPKLIRPSGLPIYSVEDSCSKDTPCSNKTQSALEHEISRIRKSVQQVFVKFSDVSESISSTFETGIQHSTSMIDYLREEENLMPRVGAIAIGGLTGTILGLRGGTAKRLIYTTLGATSAAAVCYPKQAEENFRLAQRYAEIGLHFVWGDGESVKDLKQSFRELTDIKLLDPVAGISQYFARLKQDVPSLLQKEEPKKPTDAAAKQE